MPALALVLTSTAFAVDPDPSTSATAKGQPPPGPVAPNESKSEAGPIRPLISNATGADSGFAAPIPDRSTEAVDRERSRFARAMDGEIRRTAQGLKAAPKPQEPKPNEGQPTQTREPPAQNPAAEKQSPTAEAPKQDRQTPPPKK